MQSHSQHRGIYYYGPETCHQDPPAAWQLKPQEPVAAKGSLAPWPPPTRTSLGSLRPRGCSRDPGKGEERGYLSNLTMLLLPRAPGTLTPPTHPASHLFPFHTQALCRPSGTRPALSQTAFPLTGHSLPRVTTAASRPAGPLQGPPGPGCQSSETRTGRIHMRWGWKQDLSSGTSTCLTVPDTHGAPGCGISSNGVSSKEKQPQSS